MKISFIICTYSTELFFDTLRCVNSIINQDYKYSPNHMDSPIRKEIIVVANKQDELFDTLTKVLKNVTVIISEKPCLSAARNTGIKQAMGDIIVFIDDDAYADEHFIENLIKIYEDKNVIGTSGKILPIGKPNYPEELYWIGGFTNKGYAEEKSEVRNAYGCNMSFRKEVFDKVGMFNTDFGRIGKKLVTCEETEFSIKALAFIPDSKIIYDPSVIVHHKVHEFRQSFGYMVKRAYFEGKSKASIDKLYKENKGTLASENNYLRYLLIEVIPLRLKNMIKFKSVLHNTKDIISILSVIGAVGIGYMMEKLK